MTKKELIEFANDNLKEFVWEDLPELGKSGWECEEVEQVGGEDEGSHYHVVFKCTKGSESFYLYCLGYYSSWDGTEWESAYEVTPYEKTVRDWKAV